MKLRYLRDAQREVRDGVAYYHERNPQAARGFTEALRDEERRILQHPLAATRIRADFRARKIPRFPYSLIYRVQSDEILIVALAHHSRRPEYWSGRISETS
jgi:addiction module RelE/StbE family toxin